MTDVDAAPGVVGVVDWARSEFDLEIAALESITGGLDPAARVWRGLDARGGSWAVKVTTRDNRFGLLLAQALTRAGVVGVPTQLEGTGGLPWSEDRGRRLSISRWVEGREAFETGLTQAEWRAVGTLLGQVHAQEPPHVPREAPADRLHRRGIHRAGIRIARSLRAVDRLFAASATTPGQTVEVERLLDDWPDIRARIVAMRDSARSLKKSRLPTRRVSCHGDPHLGNVLVDALGQPWLIDFDDAVEAPREVDLMLIELGVLYAMPISGEDRESFYAGYGPVELDHDRILRFGSIRAIEDLLQSVLDLLQGHPERSPADLESVIRGVLSPSGLAGLIAARHAPI